MITVRLIQVHGNIVMYILNISSAIKKDDSQWIKTWDFIFENYYKQIGFVKESSYYSMKRLKRKDLSLLETKLIEKIADLNNAEEHYQIIFKKEKHKISKTIKNNYSATINFSKYQHCWYKISNYKTSKNFT